MEITIELLEQLDEGNCIRLATTYVQEFLPIFEEKYPHIIWPRERLEEILSMLEGNMMVTSKNFILPNASEFATPGSNGFINELEMLWELVILSGQEHQCPRRGAAVIAGIIMALLDNSWGLRHSDEWLQWYHSTIQGEEISEVGLLSRFAFKEDLVVRELEIAEWYKVADRIQKLLVE